MGGRRRADVKAGRAVSILGQVEIRGTPGGPRDTTSKLIKEILFNYITGNYKEDLINKLRDLLNKSDPENPRLIRIVFTPTGSTNKEEANRVAAYIDSFTVYLVGIEIKNVVWEFGSYSKTETTESLEPTQPGHRQRDRIMMNKIKKMNRVNSKLTKKKKEKAVEDKKVVRVLKDSHLLGFGEGYGDGLASPGNIKYGRISLVKAIEDIYNEFHVPKDGKTELRCFKWQVPLTVVAVMTCEGARFHPFCWYFEKLIKEGLERYLLDWLYDLLNLWASLSKLHRGEKESISYKEKIPLDYGSLTKEVVKELCLDKVWATLVLAVLWRAKKRGSAPL